VSGNGQVTNFPATTQQNQICWVGIPNDSDLVMFLNTDLNNYAYVGYTPNLVVGVNTIPIAPNASINLPASRTVYAIWSTAVGVNPLVVIPGGANYFLGLTQALGNLAIPSIQSPNFLHNVTGWQIDQNGNAEFNNLQIRGTFLGLDFIINSSGAFFYNGTPALGNLKISIASASGIDAFGNVYVDNIACYNIAVAGGGYVQIAANDVTGVPYLVLNPPGGKTVSAPPQVYGGITNAGAANEQLQTNVTSGYESGPGSTGAAVILLASRPNNGGVGSSFARLTGDNIQGVRPDGNTYPMGQLIAQGTALPQTINSTSAQTVTGCGAFTTTPGTYKVHIDAQITANAAAGNLSFQVSTSGTVSNIWGNGIIWQATGAGAGNNRFTPNLTGLLFQGPASGAVGATFYVLIDGYITFTTAGAITLQAFLSVLADTYVINNVAMTLTPNF
jgi:hypothetical protein